MERPAPCGAKGQPHVIAIALESSGVLLSFLLSFLLSEQQRRMESVDFVPCSAE